MLKFRRHLLASLLTVLLFAANRVNGANTLQFFFPIENSTSTTIDDEIAVKPVSWNSSFEPVNWVLLKPGGGSVLYSPLNIYGISDSQVFDAVVAALGEWNSNSLSNFDYDTALLFSTSPLVPSPKPTEARLDGHHLITFQSALLNSATGPVAVTSLFFLEHDISSSVIAAGVPAGEVENGVGAAVDFNGDGKADITLPVRNYKQGEIIEADIIFNKALSYRQWPADEGDVPPADLPSVPGSLDIQALLTHELGHAQGIAHTWLQDSTMFGFLNGANADFPSDPYNMRSIAFDDEMGGGFLYPKFGSSKGEIKGSIYDGQYVQYLGGTVCPSQEALLFIEQAPVFLGIPAPAGLHPDNVYSTGGVKRLIAQVMSGQSLRYPAGPGGVATLEPATTTVPNIDFNDLGEDTNRNCTLDPGEDTNFNGQLDYSTLAIDSIYRFRGLTPRSDYVVYLDKDFKGLGPSVNPVFDFLNQFEDYDPEFFGGVTAPGRPDQEKNDNPQAATNVAAAAGTVTDNINIITNVEPFVPTPTPTASPSPTASRTPSPSPTISPTPTASPTPSASPTASPSASPTPLIFDNAAVVTHTIPAQIPINHAVPVQVTMQNTGNTVWTAAGNYKLVVVSDPCAMGPVVVNLGGSDTVSPGEQFTFNFTLTGPASTGNCAFTVQMAQFGGAGFFGQSLALNPSIVAVINDAITIGNSVPPKMIPGQSLQVDLTMRNTGNTTWIPGGVFNLKVVSDPCGLFAGPLIAPLSVTSPAQNQSFLVQITAPVTPGICNAQVQMNDSGLGNFGQIMNLSVNVTTPPNAARNWMIFE